MAPEAVSAPLLQQAGEAMAAGDIDGAIVHLSAAVRELTAAGDNRGASRAAAQLGDLFQNVLGNRVAARPWFLRAVRLVEGEEPCVEQGWAALAPMGCDVDDPADLVARAGLALDRARQFADADLEIKALADGGLGHVQGGRVAEGMAMLEEAMSLACGGPADPSAVGKSVCSFYTACYYTADFGRAASWSDVFRRRGLLGASAGPGAFLSSHCDSVQASLLCHLGRWGDAEELLLRAHAALEAVMPGMAWHTPIALAELRILQGRLAEAEAFLLGKDDHIQALLPMARLHLARGDHELAAAAARRGLRLLGGDRVRAASLLGVLADAELQGGNLPAAAGVSDELDLRLQGLALPALDAEAARVRARVRRAQGEVAAAADALDEALASLRGAELPLLQMRVHLDLAHLLEPGDGPAAAVEARAATALLQRLDVILAADDLALLQRLGAAHEPPVIACRVATLRDSGAWWTAGCGDTSVRLRDTKGLRYLAALLEAPGVERAAWDLVDRAEGLPDAASGIDRRKLGDAGEVLDATGRDAYRRRAAELRDEVEDALDREDDERAARVQAELDALLAELARALGLSGQSRRASSAAEKARLNVTRSLRAAVGKLAEALPDAGEVLDRRIRTGHYCAYEPHPDDEVTWKFRRD